MSSFDCGIQSIDSANPFIESKLMNQTQLSAFEYLEQAQKAMQSGDVETARRLAALAARLAPEYEEVWLLMAALASPRGSLAYLHRALKINPRSERARKGLLWAEPRLQAQRSVAPQIPAVTNTKSIPAQAETPARPQTPLILSDTSVAETDHAPTSWRFQLPPLLTFTIRRFLTIPFSLLIITMLLYAGVMLTPVETRARLYLPPEKGGQNASEQVVRNYIKQYHLAEPYLVQYTYWITSLLRGKWGFSPIFNEDVLIVLLKLTPATAELTIYSMLVFIPLGLAGGVLAGWQQRKLADNIFRFAAFFVTSLPPIVLALLMIAFFYANLGWFAPGRLSSAFSYQLTPENFHIYTGLYTLDGLLNRRLDVTLDALRHLAMPVMTLALLHWATLARITRVTTIAEKRKDYIIAGRARGISENRLAWKHAFRNVMAPAFTSMTLSAASLVTGVFVVEIIFSYRGVSDLIVKSMRGTPDAPAALGFAVYSSLIVLILMFILDVVQAALDPRVRDEVLRS